MTAVPADTSALAVQDLSIGYGGRAIVDGISLAIARREVVCPPGGSGCGKSTLLRGLAGLEPLQAGTVRFLGEPSTAPHPRAALVFQQASLLPWLDVRGNVGYALDWLARWLHARWLHASPARAPD